MILKRELTKYEKVNNELHINFLIFFQIISAVPAGLILISDPSGNSLGFEIEMLKFSPFSSFLIPGLFLFVFLGIFPVFIFYGLIKQNEFNLAKKLNLYKDYHWSWVFSYYLGLLLILWINIELLFTRKFAIIQFVYSILGVFIVFMTHLPSTKRDFKFKPNHW